MSPSSPFRPFVHVVARARAGGAVALLALSASLLDASPLVGQEPARRAVAPGGDARTPVQGVVAPGAAQQSVAEQRAITSRSGRTRSADSPSTASRAGTRVGGGRGPVQCEKCHADRQFLAGKAKGERGDSVLFVPDTLLRDSRHKTLLCADCHAGYNDGYPHTKVASVSVSCQHCHEDQGAAYHRSIHAPNFEKKGDAPTCVSCHSSHKVLGADDRRSPTYPLNVAQLCGSCHNKKAILDAYFDKPADSTARSAVGDYRHSVHGIAMTKAGLTVSATCSDCHDAHRVLPTDSTESTLHRSNVASTCGACHQGVLATFDSSAHGQALVSGDTTETGKKAPVCIECHGGHKVVEANDPAWFSGVVEECGACHKRLLDTYFETYHGKATQLGYGIAAKCSDCHGAHAMLAADDSLSSVHPTNLVETCSQCHKGATVNFVKYKPHGDPRDRERNPELYWVWLAMTSLLIGVFAFFGVHSLLWFMRLMATRNERAAGHHTNGATTAVTPAPAPAPAPAPIPTEPSAATPPPAAVSTIDPALRTPPAAPPPEPPADSQAPDLGEKPGEKP